jgi:PadR family transcriptional regulator PadR
MTTENNTAQLKKGLLELCILAILSRRESYPPDIIAQMQEADLQVVEGTMYPLLNRLRTSGMLTYRWEESPSGPPRKYYSLTDAGKAQYEQLKLSWNELSESINKIITAQP